MKSAKEKKRKRTRRESANGDRKRRSIESSVEKLKDPKEEVSPVQEVKGEPSDVEEGGLDLTLPFKSISAYVGDRKEMLEQCFHVLGQTRLKKMLPDELKDCTFLEIKTLCWDQLQQLSETNLLQILEGKEVTVNSETEEQDSKETSLDSQQDNNVDSTSSMKEIAEGEEKQGLSGEESDVLSINADMNDSDIEGHKDPKRQEVEVPVPTMTFSSSSAPPPESALQSDEPKLELEQDIDRSVSEILALSSPSTDQAELPVAMEAYPESLPVPAAAPSAQQLALLELEMRARAIKALMKANEGKK